MTQNPGGERGISPISNAIAVLRSFGAGDPLLGVTDIATMIGLHKSSVSRILATLESENLVERDPESRRFRLGLGIIAVAGPLLANLDERRAAQPVLSRLSSETGETCALLLWSNHEAVAVEQIPSRHLVKHTSSLGSRYRTGLSASVQVFLAMEARPRVLELLHSRDIALPSEVSVDRYVEKLDDVQSRGYAINYGETSDEEVGIAAPVYDHRDDVVASVLLSAPRFRVSRSQIPVLGASCVRAAAEISQRLGGPSRIPR